MSARLNMPALISFQNEIDRPTERRVEGEPDIDPDVPNETPRSSNRSRPWIKCLIVSVGVMIPMLALKVAFFPSLSRVPPSSEVRRGTVEEAVLASGTLKPAKLVAVGAQASGRIVSLKVALGQKIAAGDLLAEIDSLPQQNSLRTAQAALQSTRAQKAEKEATLANSEAALARQQATFAQKASSRADLDSADVLVKTTKAQIAQLEAQIIQSEVAVETAKINLGYTKITAPINGTVLAVAAQEGQTVNTVQSAPTIVVLGTLDKMTIRAEISEADVVQTMPGQDVYFTILGDPERRYSAKLESIEPAPESVKNDSSFSTSNTTSGSSSSSSSTSAIYYNGVFQADNTDGRLRTYMTAEVHIVLKRAENVLTVPASALQKHNLDGSYDVGVASERAVRTQQIRVGVNNKILAEVRSGLAEGERVIVPQREADEKSFRPPGLP